MTNLELSYGKILTLAEHRTIEPLSSFESRREEGWGAYQCGAFTDIPKNVVNRGEGNNVFLGYKAQCERLKLGLYGNDITVYVGAYSAIAGDIQIKGDNITVFFGSFITVSSINITQWGDNSSFFVGDKCMISARIFSGNTDSHAIFDLETGRRINGNKDVHIGDHVWIARDVTIGKGARIGHDSVIGQGSFVSGELDSNSVYAGVPAKKLRSGITWSRGDESSIEEMEKSPRRAVGLKREAELEAYLSRFAIPKISAGPEDLTLVEPARETSSSL